MRGHFLPVLVAVVLFCTIGTTYTISTWVEGHQPYWLPTISETGNSPPESCIFSLGVTLGSFALAATIVLKFNEHKMLLRSTIGNYASTKKVPLTTVHTSLEEDFYIRFSKTNKWAARLGITATTFLGAVAAFQDKLVPLVHYSATGIFFTFIMVYMVLHTIQTNRLRSVNLGKTTKRLLVLRVLILLGCFGFYIGCLALCMIWWITGAYGFWSFAAVCEYSMAILLGCYFVTFYPDFKRFEVACIVVTPQEAVIQVQ
jgi:hypothetical protein